MFKKIKANSNVRGHPSVVAIDEYADNLNYAGVDNADLILEQARSNYQRAMASAERIEDKADSLVRFLGAGAGLAGAALSFSLHTNKVMVLGIMGLGFLAVIASLILAIVVRAPATYAAPVPIVRAIDFMYQYGSEKASLNLWLAVSYEKSAIIASLIGHEKSTYLSLSYALIVGALAVFFVALTIALI